MENIDIRFYAKELHYYPNNNDRCDITGYDELSWGQYFDKFYKQLLDDKYDWSSEMFVCYDSTKFTDLTNIEKERWFLEDTSRAEKDWIGNKIYERDIVITKEQVKYLVMYSHEKLAFCFYDIGTNDIYPFEEFNKVNGGSFYKCGNYWEQ